jgi:crotonobetainyl-CoA:carnitine CoA-transferase CaiB-like acyl-CoA transferase
MPSPVSRDPGRKRLPLEGIRILDFTVVWAGPYSTQLLAEWGAEVIRVESTKFFPSTTRGVVARTTKQMVERTGQGGGFPDKDPGSRPWNRGALFNAHARNKLSMTVDLTRPEGQDVLEQLVRVSDGLIENNAVATMERVGVNWERLSKINPELIMVRMPAFGLTGPYRSYRTFGSHMESVVGHYSVFGYQGEDPSSSGTSLAADPAAGVAGVLAFAAGLRQRRRTGKGLQIELSTAENFSSYLGEYVMDYTMNGNLHGYIGNRDSVAAPQGVYPCNGEDRWIAISIGSDEEWASLNKAMGMPELANDRRFDTRESRQENHDELDAIISGWSRNRDSIETMGMLQIAGVRAGAVMNEADAFADPHLADRGYWEELSHPEAGTHLHPGVVWRAERTPNRLERAAPRLGEDNDYVYRELLGFDDARYARFEELGHIGMDYDESIP